MDCPQTRKLSRTMARFGGEKPVTPILHLAECRGLIRKSVTEIRQHGGCFSWTGRRSENRLTERMKTGLTFGAAGAPLGPGLWETQKPVLRKTAEEKAGRKRGAEGGRPARLSSSTAGLWHVMLFEHCNFSVSTSPQLESRLSKSSEVCLAFLVLLKWNPDPSTRTWRLQCPVSYDVLTFSRS